MKQVVVATLIGLMALGSTAYGVTCTAATGTVLDLTAGGSGDINFAHFQTNDNQSTGTGVIQSFVRISTNDNCEQGYNTGGRPLQFDENNSPTFTRNLQLSVVPIVNIGGINYREFLLDINQTSNNPLLTLEKVELWQANEANLLGFTPGGAGFGANSATDIIRYTLDGAGDSYIKMNYNINSGSGSGDLFMYIPNSAFGAGTYLYLFSEFGEHNNNNDGFEEWAVRSTTIFVPEPSGLLLLGTALAGVGLWFRRRHTA